MVNIENWSIVINKTPYTAPEAVKTKIVGKVYGSEKFPEGHEVITSYVVKVIPESHSVETKTGSIYVLGSVDPAYERIYPDAYSRLFKEGKKLK